MKQSELNNFVREHFNLYIKCKPNCITHDPGTKAPHRQLVNSICEWAMEQGYTFFTRIHLKNGQIADICIPDLDIPFIEVRSSEEKKDKEYLAEYALKIQFVDASNPFKL